MCRMLLTAITLLAFCAGPLVAAKDDNGDKKASKQPAGQEAKRRPSDVVFILIETSGADEESAVELQKMYEVLRKLDKNSDGKIDPEALKAAREQMIDDRVDYLMKELDANEDGQISKDEAKGRIKEHFDRIDQDKDGFISRDELRQAVAGHRKARAKAADPR